jgi:hypothetical protein
MTPTLRDKIANMAAAWAEEPGGDDHVSMVRAVIHHPVRSWAELVQKRAALNLAGGGGESEPGEVRRVVQHDALRLVARPIHAASLADLWAEAEAMCAVLDGGGYADHEEAAEMEASALFDLEDRVLNGPIQTSPDAAAKLKAVALSAERGDRQDGADQRALLAVVQWLEARS